MGRYRVSLVAYADAQPRHTERSRSLLVDRRRGPRGCHPPDKGCSILMKAGPLEPTVSGCRLFTPGGSSRFYRSRPPARSASNYLSWTAVRAAARRRSAATRDALPVGRRQRVGARDRPGCDPDRGRVCPVWKARPQRRVPAIGDACPHTRVLTAPLDRYRRHARADPTVEDHQTRGAAHLIREHLDGVRRDPRTVLA